MNYYNRPDLQNDINLDNFKPKKIEKKKSLIKWVAVGLGAMIGISYIGILGALINRMTMPTLNLPVGEYTSYSVRANKDGYEINYRANDPLVMEVTKDSNRPAGFLGFGKATLTTKEHYTMDGSRHLQGKTDGKISADQIKCIEAAGAGKQTGRMVGGSVGASVASSGLASIPYVGWVLSGAATMLGMEQGAEIGGQMALDFADCDPEE